MSPPSPPSLYQRLRILNFDIDAHLRPFLPPSFLHCLPTPLPRFLGHRAHPDPPAGNVLHWLQDFIGVFTSIVLLNLLFARTKMLGMDTPDPVTGVMRPSIIASSGATSILLFSTPHSPLTQPRPFLLGHLLSTTTALLLTTYLPPTTPLPVTAALCCALASLAMHVTRTTYPPAGATALLVAVDPGVRGLGWGLLGVVGAAGGVMGGVGLVVQGLGSDEGRWPIWWVWEGEREREREREGRGMGRLEEGKEVDGDVNVGREEAWWRCEVVRASAEGLRLPVGFVVYEEERRVLERLRERLCGGVGGGGGGSFSTRFSGTTATSPEIH